DIRITGPSHGKCGYCHGSRGSRSSHTFGFLATRLSVTGYQQLIDRGWRRSGRYLYHPHPATSCCKLYTIRLNVTQYQLTHGQRKVLKRAHRWTDARRTLRPPEGAARPARPSAASPPLDWTRPMCAISAQMEDPRVWRTELVPTAFAEDAYALYRSYQIGVHGDDPDRITREQYRQFLVDSPLVPLEASRAALPARHPEHGYGSFHLRYYLNGQLVAVSVLDILPRSVSSVYFFYDLAHKHLGLGHYSALHEIGWTQRLYQRRYPHAPPITSLTGFGIRYYYLGYYIHDCAKMRYKGSYQPSELLCPVTQTW
ncbi:hypothetical protein CAUPRSCDRAFT_5250, partial [Caulochytrium protostelioides]